MGPWLRQLARMALSEAAIATTWRCTSIPAPLAPIQWLPLAATAPAPATATFAHMWALVSAIAVVAGAEAVVAGVKAVVAARALALAELRAVVAARAYHALVVVREVHALVAAGALALSRR